MRASRRKLTSGILTLVLLLNLLPTAALAAGACTKTEGCQLSNGHDGFCENGNALTVYDYAQFKDAIERINAASDGVFVISLGADITDPLKTNNGTDLSFTKNTTTILGNGHTIYLKGNWAHISASGPDVAVNLGAADGSDTLVIDGTFGGPTGENRYKSPVLVMQGATFNMYAGVTICNSYVPSTAGAVYLGDGSIFNMYGGIITNCKSDSVAGGAIALGNSAFHMSGGTISNCSGLQGGGVLLTEYSTMTMSGGRIENCSAGYYGGGILANSISVIGSGTTNSSSRFTMTGGEIVRCSAGYYGGGVCINNAYKKTFSATACLEGGSIVGCSADIYGGGLANLYAKATVNGTAIHSNTAASAGDDIVSFARPTGELSISSVGDSWELDDCDHPIDGWYDDGTGSYRWNVHDDKQPLYTEKVESGKYTTTIALKAAHGSGHTVTFDTQGGSAVDSQTVFSGTAVEPDVPTKTDYVFGGWYKDSLCTEAYDFSAPVTNSITLYARWLSASPHYILRYGDGRPEDGGDPYTFPYDPANPASLPTEVRYFSQEEIDQLSTGIYQGVTTEGNYFLAWFGYMPTLESTINTNYPVYEKTAVDTYTEFTGMPIPGKTYYQFIPCETTPDTNLGDIIYYAQWVKVKIDIAVNVQVDVDVSFDENLGGNVVMIADSQKQELAKNFKASDIVSNNCAITLTATVANPRNTAEEETTAEFLTQNYPNCRSISYDVEIRKDIESNGSWYSTVILKELEAPVEITFAVPEEWKSGTVKMLRAHTEGGAVTVDECVDLDQDRQTFTLSRDKFSTYTMLYIPAGGGGGGGIETACTLRYQSNGGTGYPDETRINPWIKNYADLPVPVREGYSFTGWYADSTLQTPITGDVLVNRNLVTIYAGWKKSTVPEMLNGAEHFAYVQGYTDGTVRPNENITRAEVATIFFRLLKDEIRDEYLTDTNTFADVTEGMWYNKAVSTMVALDVFKGRTPERFDPRAPITRGEFAAICSRFDRSEVIPRSVFTDIDGYWAKEEIERAAALGWVGGYGDGSYRPRDYISRAQVMTIINRMLLRNPESEENLLPGMKTWSDNKPGSWCYLAVQEATNSHEFRRKVNGYESWTVLKANPDWSIYQ